MKVVIQILGEKALVGVQDTDTDPFVEPVQASEFQEVLNAVPSIVARAKELWATKPKGPAYQLLAHPPREPVAAMSAQVRTPAKPAGPKEGEMAKMF